MSDNESDDERLKKKEKDKVSWLGDDCLQLKQKVDEEWSLASAGVLLDDYDVNLEHQRIGTIRGLEKLENVECLCLRNNMVRFIEGVDMLVTLNELDLYDNMLKRIEHIAPLVNLTILDLRF